MYVGTVLYGYLPWMFASCMKPKADVNTLVRHLASPTLAGKNGENEMAGPRETETEEHGETGGRRQKE